MSAQKRIGLNDLRDLLPIRNRAREKQQRHPFGLRQARVLALDVAVQHNQRVTERGALREQLRAAARDVSERAGDEIGVCRLCDAIEELVRRGGQT